MKFVKLTKENATGQKKDIYVNLDAIATMVRVNDDTETYITFVFPDKSITVSEKPEKILSLDLESKLDKVLDIK